MSRTTRTSAIDTPSEKVGQATYVDIPNAGSVRDLDLGEKGIEIVDGPSLGEYAAELAFMEEPVEIILHESTDQNAEPIVDLYCNGTPQRIVRGEPQTVKRKYVQILADARQTALTTVTRLDGGNVVNRISKHSALRYPFSIQADRNPNGRAWIKKVLASVR